MGTAALALISIAAKPHPPQESIGPPPLYQQLRDARLESAGHIRNGTFWVDRVEIELLDGELYLLEPVEGRITGAVFLGDGRVKLAPPDAVEHVQFDKLLDEDTLDEEFERAVLRFSDDSAERLRALTVAPSRANLNRAQDAYQDRHEEIFKERLANPDSRILVDLLNGGGDYFLAEVDGEDHDWFAIEVEPLEKEEVRLFQYKDRLNIWDTWASFHRLEDYGYQPGSRPETTLEPDEGFDPELLPLRPELPLRERWSEMVNLSEVEVDIALEGSGKARASSEITVEALQPMSAIRLTISTLLEATDVRWVDEDQPPSTRTPVAEESEARPRAPDQGDPEEPRPLTGEPLHFVQEKYNRRMDEDLYEPRITVQLPRPISAGETFRLQIGYQGEFIERIQNFGFLIRDTQFWYPQHMDSRRTRFNLTFRVPERYRIVSGGTLLEEQIVDGIRIEHWVQEQPVRLTSFQYGNFEVHEVDLDELGDDLDGQAIDRAAIPPITIYSNEESLGFAPGNRERAIRNLVGSLQVNTDYFGPYPYDHLSVSETTTVGGQAFGGFLTLSFQTFGSMHTGEAELFRSHEVAHQWWGANIDWQSYRDQWLSEGFAQYAAALYILIGRQEEEQFREMMDAWRYDVLGRVNVGQGLGLRHYGFAPAVIRESEGNESGALVLGFRLRSSETPFDYRLLVYEKGAYILHMLRMMMIDLDSGDDEPFRRMMRSFAAKHSGGMASTASFEETVSEAFGEPMDWFFDQWVYGTEVPHYEPDLDVVRVSEGSSPYALRGTISQEEVSEGFRMPVPIKLTFADRPPIYHRVWVDQEEVAVDLPLPARPEEIEFNYLYSVLAWVK